jgi:chemotaxis protein MotD
VASVVSEVGAAQSCHAGQGLRSNGPAGTAPSSAFAGLLEQTDDAPPPPSATAVPAAAAAPAPSRPPAPAAPSSDQGADAAARDGKSQPVPPRATGNAAAPAQAASNGDPPAPKAKSDAARAAAPQAVAALTSQTSSKPGAPEGAGNNADGATTTASPLDAGAGDLIADASTATGKTGGKRNDKSAGTAPPDSVQAAPAGDPSANQLPVAAAPVAVALNANPIVAAAPVGGDQGAAADAVAGDAAPLAALGTASLLASSSAANAPGRQVAASAGTAASDADNGDGRAAAAGADSAAAASPGPQLILQDLVSSIGGRGPNQDNAQQSPSGGTGAAEASAGQAPARNAPQRQFDVATGLPGSFNPARPAGVIAILGQPTVAGSANPDPAAVADGAASAPAQHVATDSASPADSSALVNPQGLAAPASPAVAATTPSAPANAAQPATSAYAPLVPIAGLAVEIAARAQAGASRFDLRLDPPELGRIDVRLDVDRDGKVTSHLVVERPETLAVLSRDASELQRSLQQAGLTTADDGLQFSLRDQGFGNPNPNPQQAAPQAAARIIVPEPELPAVTAMGGAYGRLVGTGSGIDIRV